MKILGSLPWSVTCLRTFSILLSYIVYHFTLLRWLERSPCMRCSISDRKFCTKGLYMQVTAAVAQSVRAFTSQAEDWVFETQQWQTYDIKTGSDSSTHSKRAEQVSRVPRDDHYKRIRLGCSTLKNPHYRITTFKFTSLSNIDNGLETRIIPRGSML